MLTIKVYLPQLVKSPCEGKNKIKTAGYLMILKIDKIFRDKNAQLFL